MINPLIHEINLFFLENQIECKYRLVRGVKTRLKQAFPFLSKPGTEVQLDSLWMFHWLTACFHYKGPESVPLNEDDYCTSVFTTKPESLTH